MYQKQGDQGVSGVSHVIIGQGIENPDKRRLSMWHHAHLASACPVKCHKWLMRSPQLQKQLMCLPNSVSYCTECSIKIVPDAALGGAGRPVEAGIPAHKAVMAAFCSLRHCLWDRAQHGLHHG